MDILLCMAANMISCAGEATGHRLVFLKNGKKERQEVF
jgi:hypothetical protein